MEISEAALYANINHSMFILIKSSPNLQIIMTCIESWLCTYLAQIVILVLKSQLKLRQIRIQCICFSYTLEQQKFYHRLIMENLSDWYHLHFVWLIAPSFLIRSFSHLQISRIGMKSFTTLKLYQIGLLFIEALVLECWKAAISPCYR